MMTVRKITDSLENPMWDTRKSEVCLICCNISMDCGRWHIIPQLAVYTTYIPLIYCLLGGYIIPTTLYRNLKNPLNIFKKREIGAIVDRMGSCWGHVLGSACLTPTSTNASGEFTNRSMRIELTKRNRCGCRLSHFIA